MDVVLDPKWSRFLDRPPNRDPPARRSSYRGWLAAYPAQLSSSSVARYLFLVPRWPRAARLQLMTRREKEIDVVGSSLTTPLHPAHRDAE
jgi:hypothetical protein